MNWTTLANAGHARCRSRILTIASGNPFALNVAAHVADIYAVASQMVPSAVVAATVESLERDLSLLAIDDLKAFAVQAHPTAANRALQPRIV